MADAGVRNGTAISRGAPIGYQTIDLVKPWVAEPQTILLHHGLGSTSAIWAEWLKALVDRYRIVRFDVRGHGRSRASLDLEPTLDRLGDDALAVVDAAGVGRFHYVGESMGGTIGLRLAVRHPDRLATITTCNSPYRGEALQSVEPLRALIASEGMAKWSADSMGIRFTRDVVSPAVWDWFEKTQAEMSPEFFLACLQMLGKVDLTDQLGAIHCPVLILGGDASPAVPVAMAADLRAKLPDARQLVFPHARHGIAVSHGLQCGEALAKFLAEKAG